MTANIEYIIVQDVDEESPNNKYAVARSIGVSGRYYEILMWFNDAKEAENFLAFASSLEQKEKR